MWDSQPRAKQHNHRSFIKTSSSICSAMSAAAFWAISFNIFGKRWKNNMYPSWIWFGFRLALDFCLKKKKKTVKIKLWEQPSVLRVTLKLPTNTDPSVICLDTKSQHNGFRSETDILLFAKITRITRMWTRSTKYYSFTTRGSRIKSKNSKKCFYIQHPWRKFCQKET